MIWQRACEQTSVSSILHSVIGKSTRQASWPQMDQDGSWLSTTQRSYQKGNFWTLQQLSHKPVNKLKEKGELGVCFVK